MTRIFLSIIALVCVFNTSYAQTSNVFPSEGNVGIGTLNPRSVLDVASKIPDSALGVVFGRLAEGDAVGSGTFLGTQGYGTGIINGKSFSIIHNFYGETNSSINFHRGGSIVGGFITFNIYSNIESVRIDPNGNVGIGTSLPDSKLSVNGNIRAKEIKVENTNWPDYVFEKGYQLSTLKETEQFIKEKGHLPGIPTSAEVKLNGIDLGEMNAKLLQKIEELTLHLIDQAKSIKELKNKNHMLEIKQSKKR